MSTVKEKKKKEKLLIFELSNCYVYAISFIIA